MRERSRTPSISSAQSLLRRLCPEWNVRLEAGAQRFVPFTPPERTRLGVARSRLGRDALYGTGCVDAEGLVRLLVGPFDTSRYESLMPGGECYAWLERVTRQIFAGSLEVELEVEVAPQQAPLCALGRGAGGRLGVDARYSADREGPVRVRVRLLQDAATARRTFVEETHVA
jgi:predicted component of type VI protein secretion system